MILILTMGTEDLHSLQLTKAIVDTSEYKTTSICTILYRDGSVKVKVWCAAAKQ